MDKFTFFCGVIAGASIGCAIVGTGGAIIQNAAGIFLYICSKSIISSKIGAVIGGLTGSIIGGIIGKKATYNAVSKFHKFGEVSNKNDLECLKMEKT